MSEPNASLILEHVVVQKRPHAYLSGNFAPIHSTVPLTPCVVAGTIPSALSGGEYVRNGGNPLTNEDLGREAHWFDGDGMLSGVLFQRLGEKGNLVEPQFVNRYLVTDVFAYSTQNKKLRRPLLVSIATLVSPLNSLLTVIWAIFRTVILALLSRSLGRTPIKKISVANTSVLYHDGRALATCESGPPLRFALPGLETIGWFNGRKAENEPMQDEKSGFGGNGVMKFMRQWTTAHPKVDRTTGELLSFHSTFAKPYVRYSVVKPSKQTEPGSSLFELAVPGIEKPKMMHDFGVSKHHTIIMDLPLSLDPLNFTHGLPSLHYDTSQKSRFGVFPRYAPEEVQWFETNPCLIFHTVNCWDETTPATRAKPFPCTTVNLLASRLTSASMIFMAGNMAPPKAMAVPPEYYEEEQCRLYYYSFPLASHPELEPSHIGHQWALSTISFEFSTVAPDCEMQELQYVYGCSSSDSFTVALGKAAKINYLAKMDVRRLIARGKANPPQSVRGCVDQRTLSEIMASDDPNDPIKLFELPEGFYAQEPCFVPREEPRSEDDGWLLTYVFDESQLDERGDCHESAKSELWIIDARNMEDVVAKVLLPQRVPYGLHGSWFSEEDIQQQKPFDRVREVEVEKETKSQALLAKVRDAVEAWVR